MMWTTGALSQWKSRYFPFQLGSPESQGHGNCIQLSPVFAHLLVSECLLGEGTLAPLTLKIATKPFITSIGK